MADINISISKTLVHEGGFVDNLNDSGGATKYGITQRDMPDKNIKDITTEDAIEYYKEHYVKNLYTQIEDQAKLDKLFDMGVLFGIGTAINLAQRVLGLIEDGIFGSDTLEHVNATDMLQLYKNELVSHVTAIVTAQPKDRVFFAGWINRINS